MQRIKEVRKLAGLTQEKFAERIGIKRNSLCSIEIGTNNPSNQVILSICREFGVREDWLRHGEGEMRSAQGERPIDELAREYDLCPVEQDILAIYLELPKQDRERFTSKLTEVVLSNLDGEAPPAPAPAAGDKTPPVPPAPAHSAEAEKKPPESEGAAGIRSETAEMKKAAEAERLAMQKRLDEMQAALDGTKAALDDTKAALDDTKAALDAERLEKAKLEGELKATKETNEKFLRQWASAPADAGRLALERKPPVFT